jgi:hypothetical protein
MNNIIISLILCVIIGSMIIPIWAANKKEKFNQYAVEEPKSYFENLLNPHLVNIKTSDQLILTKSPDVLEKIKDFIKGIFTQYEIIESEIVTSFLDRKNYVYVVGSKVLLHRLDKMHGILISVRTLHNLELEWLKLIKYDVSLISQDKFALMSNKIGITMQEYGKDELITKGAKYEEAYLKQHYADIQKYRGITYNTNF